MRRELAGGFVLDDDPARIDRDEVHRFLSTEAYWAIGRSRSVVDDTLDAAARLVGIYLGGAQVGFARVLSDGHTMAYLADVYVLEEHRGRGLGSELVRFTVLEGPLAGVRKWGLHTRDAHEVYRRLGFVDPDGRFMERWNLAD